MDERVLHGGFRKLTGPIEHWVTTYHTEYWGFRPDKKEAWEEIEEGEIFLFHASASRLLDVPPSQVRDVGKGVIGLGKVGAKSTKDEPAWWEEVHYNGEYPYLVHFSEIHWFGDTTEIRDTPVKQKSKEEMVEDIKGLDQSKISFGEMDERANYRIPAQGSPTNISQPEKLFPLLLERIQGVAPEKHDTDESSTQADRDSERTSKIRSRKRDRDLEPDSSTTSTVTYESSIDETMSGWMEHEHSLDTFEDELLNAGFETGETKYSDILASDNTHIVLAEAKSIHDGNQEDQIRKALGQLEEYSYFEVHSIPKRKQKELTKCLVLTSEPSEEYAQFLQHLQSHGVYTFWTDEYEIKGFPESMERLHTITG
ncbi:hypothetical protein [Halorhabdus rudnickae]|uniref:hypothetical protein n=1 Tax=Halorhabdus rudnickae TaxID=1775544 RepID=UPI0010837FD3|nr:hypothetical protein [Halorhabdus rudnickae]